jgi:hypothetical protein
VEHQVHQSWEALATSQGGWRALAQECRALPEWTPAWCIPWWRELGPGRLRAVSLSDDDGELLALGLFCESRMPGPRFMTALGRGTAPAVAILARPGRPDAVLSVVGHALGTGPAAMVLAGTVDREVIEAGAAAHGLTVSARPHPPARILTVDQLAAAPGPASSGTHVEMGTEPRQHRAGLSGLVRALGFEPGPEAERRREHAFLVTVLDAFGRAGDLVWPIATDDDRLLASSAWLVHHDRASLWLRWTAPALRPEQARADVEAAIGALRARGVREVVLRNGESLAAGLGTGLGAETVLVTNRPALRRLEPLAWALVRSRAR